MGILYKCKKYFNQSTLLMLYNVFVYPYYNYCVTISGNTCKTYIDPLLKLQKRAVRIIRNVPFRTHTAPLFNELNILTLCKLHVYAVQLLMYKHKHSELPDIFSSFFVPNSMIHNYFTRQHDCLHVPLIHGNLAGRNLRSFGVKTFNYFNSRIGMLCSYAAYKRRLKLYLLNNDWIGFSFGPCTVVTRPWRYPWMLWFFMSRLSCFPLRVYLH